MAEEITADVGDLYAELHEQYAENLGDQYSERLRQNLEEFIHNFNQQVERQRDAVSEQEDLDLAAGGGSE
jgi:flagellar biosynthesis chaperone FliJ